MVLISWIDYVMLGFAILLLVFLILLVGRFLHALLKGAKNPQGITTSPQRSHAQSKDVGPCYGLFCSLHRGCHQ